MNTKTLLSAVAALALTIGAAGAVSAQTFDQTHPQRAQVNERLANQNVRIDRAEARGQITPMKAARLHRADHRVRMAERREARFNHGRITKAEQVRLNHRENRISRRIG